jgi:hypothetical protein
MPEDAMDISVKRLHDLRNTLLDRFRSFARAESVVISPSENIRTLDVCDRLYDERAGDRRLNIDIDTDSPRDLRGFYRSSEWNGATVHLITLYSDGKSMDWARLWNVRRSWLADREISDKALDGIPEA